MTIEEIDLEISKLKEMRAEKKRELLKDQTQYIGKFYKDTNSGCIGRIQDICEEDGNIVCNEITLHGDSLYTEDNVIYCLDQVDIISESEILHILNEWMDNIKSFIELK